MASLPSLRLVGRTMCARRLARRLRTRNPRRQGGPPMPSTLSPARPLGQTGVQVPLIGYGTAPLGQKGVSRQLAVRCLNEAIDRGITYLDTSPDYGSEELVGAVMKGRRDEVFLATKVNRRSRDGVIAELKESL